MTPTLRTLGLAAMLAWTGGCAPSAIFELELELPASGPAARYAVVTAMSGGQSVSLSPALELAPGCTRPSPAPNCELRTLDPQCSVVVSVVSDEAPPALSVEVMFCDSPDCAGGGVVHQVDVERPFYPGRYTQGRVCLDQAPDVPSVQTVARCEVRCREGTSQESCRLDGTHFCE